MTEDDTFRILSRPSFNEMFAIIDIWIYDGNDNRKIQEVLAENKWSEIEYNTMAVYHDRR